MLSDLFSSENLLRCNDSRLKVLSKRKHQEDEYREYSIGGLFKAVVKPGSEGSSINFKLTKTYRVRYKPDNYLPRLHHKIEKYGFAVIEKGKKNIIRRKTLQQMLEKAIEIEEIVCNRLDFMDIPCRNISKKVVKQVNDGNKQCNFKFQEVSTRCLGRLDVKYGMDKAPFNDANIIDNPIIKEIVGKILGSDADLKYCGLIYSFPGSSDQSFHGDGSHLYDIQLPPHALNIFVPLTDISLELGPTEFFPKSHLLSNVSGINEMLENSINIPKGEVIPPLLSCGDLLIYDYRTIHRGVRNTTLESCRYMFYMLWTKPWFQETINFSDISIFSDNIDTSTPVLCKNEDENSQGYQNL